MSLSSRILALALLITAASAQWWRPGSGDDGFGRGANNLGNWFNGNGNSGGNTGTFYPLGLNGFDLNKNYRKAATARIAHASLASAAFVFFFPVGAIALRILPGRLALIVHALCQLFAYLIFTVAFIIGIWMSLYVSSSDYHLIRLYHPIIGIVIFCLLFFQPFTGILHHRGFKRHGTRTGVSYLHISFGRLLITFGMINGGLGLMLAANATRGEIIAYGVIAGVMWVLWMGIALSSEFRRTRRPVAVDGAKGSAVERNAAAEGTNGTNGTRAIGEINEPHAIGTNGAGAGAATRDAEKFA